MDAQQILGAILQAGDDSAYARQTAEELERLMERMGPEMTSTFVLEWLDEKLYFMLVWKKKHEQEGQQAKADAEEEKARVLSAMKASVQALIPDTDLEAPAQNR